MARFHFGKDNWFLVLPAAILGLVALLTVNRMYRSGDIRRAIEVVTTFRPTDVQADSETLGEYLSRREGALNCSAKLLSEFYGKLDVECTTGDAGNRYRWRVLVGQLAFAPADEPTRQLMAAFAPEIFHRSADEEGEGH